MENNLYLPKLEKSKDFIKPKDQLSKVLGTDNCFSIEGIDLSYQFVDTMMFTRFYNDNLIEILVKIMMHTKENSRILAMPSSFITTLLIQNFDLASKIFHNFLGKDHRHHQTSFIKEYDMILLPVNWESKFHWTLLVIDFKLFRFFHIDSDSDHSGISTVEVMKLCCKVLGFLYVFKNNDMRDYLDANAKKFQFFDTEQKLPRQKDVVSCGVFVVMNMFSIMKYQALTNFLPEKMVKKFRVFVFHVLSHFHKVNSISEQLKKNKDQLTIFSEMKDDSANIIRESDVEELIGGKNYTVIRGDPSSTQDVKKEVINLKTKISSQVLVSESKKRASSISVQESGDETKSDDDSSKTRISFSNPNFKKGKASKKGKSSSDINAKPNKRKESDVTDGTQPKEPQKKLKVAKENQLKLKGKDKEIEKVKGTHQQLVPSSRRFKVSEKMQNNWFKKDKAKFDDAENELIRLTRTMKCKFVGYHEKEKRYFVSNSSRTNILFNTMRGTKEIFQLHKEFIADILKRFTGVEKKSYEYFFHEKLVQHNNHWHSLDAVLQEQLVTFYRTERAALAFDTKDYSHLIYKKNVNKVYGRIYSGAAQLKLHLYHENELTETNISDMGYSIHCLRAKKNQGVMSGPRSKYL